MSYTKKQAALDAKQLWERIANEPMPDTKSARVNLKYRIAWKLGFRHVFGCPYCEYAKAKDDTCTSCPASGLWIGDHCEKDNSQYIEYVANGNIEPMLSLVSVVLESSDSQ